MLDCCCIVVLLARCVVALFCRCLVVLVLPCWFGVMVLFRWCCRVVVVFCVGGVFG